MDQKAEISEFLASRRARISPQSVGLPVAGRKRRVPGLRREEVAALAGLSVDYYIRLERGAIVNASDSVLQAVARALQLDPAEQAHLADLARAGQPSAAARPRRTPPAAIAPQLQAVLDALVGVPALVRSPTLDLIATNSLARALYSELYTARTARAQRRRTSPGSPSSTPAPASSGPTGSTSPTTSSPTSGPPPIRSTGPCPTSSASCPPAATPSASSGPGTTCARTRAASSTSATRSSARSRCTTTTSSWRPNPG